MTTPQDPPARTRFAEPVVDPTPVTVPEPTPEPADSLDRGESRGAVSLVKPLVPVSLVKPLPLQASVAPAAALGSAATPVPADLLDPAGEVGPEPTPSVAPPASTPDRRTPKGLLVGLAALVLVLAVAAGLATVYATDGSQAAVAASRKDGLTAARSAARLVFSYDYRRLDQDFQAGRAVTTGSFQAEYDRTTKRLVDDVAPRYKAVVIADVSNAGVVSAGTDTIVAIVFVNQQSSSSLLTTPKLTQSRLEMTMVKRDGRWLVEKIKAL